MVRFIAVLVILLGAGFAYEVITGNNIGITSTMRALGDILGGWGQGARSPAFGGWGNLGG